MIRLDDELVLFHQLIVLGNQDLILDLEITDRLLHDLTIPGVGLQVLLSDELVSLLDY